jgi:cysteine-rich repeat protein
MSRRLLALNLCALALCWSCQSALSKRYDYKAELAVAVGSPEIKIRLIDFIDERPPLDMSDFSMSLQNQIKKDNKAASIWAKNRFGGVIGVTHDNDDFAPLSRVLRDLAQDELQNAGAQVLVFDEGFTEYSALMKSAKAQGADWVLIGKINKLFAKEIPGSTPGKKFVRGVFVTLFIAVYLIVWVALLVASNGANVNGPGLLSFLGGKSKKKKYWQLNVELTFWLCSPDRGCLWKASFYDRGEAKTEQELFSSMLPSVMQEGLHAALQEATKKVIPSSQPQSTPSLQPASKPAMPRPVLVVPQLATCGNHKLDTGEVCDDGNNASNDGCSADCKKLERCGNGVLDAGEECDEGGLSTPTTCRPGCKKSTCGDGVLDVGEVCDDGNNVDNDTCRNNCLTVNKRNPFGT